ncbi:uncharacterized protein LOC128860125 isoform X2 [Anastrepha ludens]|uniref:uncharacterized protein LOC128860125 isoform X2 n=1 Tax=Anastrepha ludens TaxID=28586 RepID=UPI0023B049C0|nr:uncharacterized protein LOC128860125 isoform X2 [Anastrepha ludens]
MRSTKSDNALEHQLWQQQQHQNSSSYGASQSFNSQSPCFKYLSERILSCLDAKRATSNVTTTDTVPNSETSRQVHHLLQRHCIAFPSIHQRSALSLSDCLWLRSSQLLLRRKFNSAGYQQSSTATSETKTTTTKVIVINIHTTSRSHTRHPHTNINTKRCLTRSPSLVLLSLLLLWFSHLIGSSCAAPQSCVLCDINDFNDRASNTHTYEEYHFEHQVTRQEAITALKTFNVSNYGEPSGCAVSCSEKVMKYCLGPQFINDHCWCELGHTEEGLPFVPHICYVGEKHYKATVGSCYFYEQVKECCCAPVLVKQWRHISAASRQMNAGSLLLLTILSLIFNATRSRTCK